MNDGLEQVRIIIGDDGASGISDAEIKDVLWETFFDIEQTTEWALGPSSLSSIYRRAHACATDEIERRRVAKERKGEP